MSNATPTDLNLLEVHISTIKASDTVFHDGETRTVCPKDIKQDAFMGVSIFGDTYRSGRQPVLRVVYKKFYKGREL
jgi:hypothetical protein